MARALRHVVAALLLFIAAAPAAAQDVQALSWLFGRWQGAGTMFGRPSQAVLEVGPALGGRFAEMRYRAGNFEGRAFYRPADGGGWQARWFDNRGVSFPIEAQLAERTLTSEWGPAETERGRTIYRLLEDGRLEVLDTVAAPGGDREFARHIFTRAP